MKTRALLLLLAAGSLALAAWLVHAPTSTQADEVPEQYRSTVQKARAYLLKAQHKDGHWEGADGQHPVAMTGLVGLALLLGGDKGEFTGLVDNYRTGHCLKAVDWLMASAKPDRDGLIFSGHASETSRYMEGHGLATLFLSGALNFDQESKRREKMTVVLQRAVQYIVKAQSTQGGWYHTSKVEGHDFERVLPTVIQIQALQAAENAGILVPGNVITSGQDYLKAALKRPVEPGSRLLDSAAALVASIRHSNRDLSRVPPKLAIQDEVCKGWLKYCQDEVPVGQKMKFGRDELVHYYHAQAVFTLQADWGVYRKAMFDHLQQTQNKDGSWAAAEGIGIGSVYTTALWCIVQQLDHRSHPSIPTLSDVK